MEEVSRAYVELIRQYAAKKFPPREDRVPGGEPFNLSQFLKKAFGKIDNKKWERIANVPGNIRLADALKMAKAVGADFDDLLATARVHADLDRQEAPGDRPSETPKKLPASA
jgi:hypothetical protein